MSFVSYLSRYRRVCNPFSTVCSLNRSRRPRLARETTWQSEIILVDVLPPLPIITCVRDNTFSINDYINAKSDERIHFLLIVVHD